MIQPKAGLKYFRFFFVAFIFISSLFIGQPAWANPAQGLTQDVYTFDSSILPDRQEYTLCNTSVVPNINFDVGGDVVANCQQDFVLIHWYGYITLPIDGEITFQSFADDGFYFDVGGQNVINDWTLKGCSGNTGTHTFVANQSQKVDIWWYEYGGGACNLLYYTDPVTAFTLVPDSAWTTEAVAIVEPPIDPVPVEPTDPPVDPVTPDPPVVDPVIPEPPLEPVIPDPPVTPEEPIAPPIVPTEPDRPIIELPAEVPTAQESLNTLVDIAPSEMTDAQVEQLREVAYAVLESNEQGSPEYEKALDALFIAAQADDIVIDEELANTPVIGAAVVALADAINFLGNIGADISPKVREESQKVVVGAIVVGQIAGTASLSAMRRTGK